MKGGISDVGDRALVKKVAFDGKYKRLADRWEDEPYLVVTILNLT